MIEIGTREDHPGYRSISYAFYRIWMDFWVVIQLLTKIGGGIDQKPSIIIHCDRQLRLGPGSNVWALVAQIGAVRAGTVPLRKAATCGGPQNLNPHENRLRFLRECRS